MSLTLGLTGMDPATEAALKAAFLEANTRLGDRWSLVPDAEADHVVVDMDSMYGPMSWLRLHAAGRQVIGLTSAPRTQTDYRLGRPFEVGQLVTLLADVARGAGIELESDAGAAPTARSGAAAEASEAAPAPAVEEAPVQQDSAPAAVQAAQASEAAAAAEEDDGAFDDVDVDPVPQATADGEPTTAELPSPPAPMPLREPSMPTADASAARDLAAWLQAGTLAGRVRYRGPDGTTLLIDPAADTWHGPTALKAIAACFEGPAAEDRFEPLDDATWQRESAAAGAPQPLARLRWLGGLLAGKGELLPGLEVADRFQLHKWPQTEREYPRHFRIATQMMKGPSTLAEIAAASGVLVTDVADFINANVATGFAGPVVEAPPATEEPVKARGGLLGRLRSR